MDVVAHRIISQARALLVDELRLGSNGPGQDSAPRVPHPHGLDDDQARQLDRIARELWEVMSSDPAPPECAHCASPIAQPLTGRPRKFCDDACKAADYRARRAGGEATKAGPR